MNNKPKILAISEVMPITIFEEEFYSSYNSLINLINTEVDNENIKKGKDVEKDRNKINSHSEIIFNIIDKEFLLELFIEEIQSKDILVEAIKKFKILNENNYKNNSSYQDAINKLAYSVQLKQPRNALGNRRGEIKIFGL